MTIKRIRASRIPNRAIVYFDDGSFLPVSVDDVYRLHLTSGLDIDLVDVSLNYLLYNYSLFQLSLSPKLPRELSQKLKTKYHQYSQKYHITSSNISDIISQIISNLESKNLLSEKSYVESIVHRYTKKPTRYIVQFLRAKGVDTNQYPDLHSHDDSSLLAKVLTTKKYQNIKTADFNTKRKLIASLVRFGFAYDDIKSAIDYCPSD